MDKFLMVLILGLVVLVALVPLGLIAQGTAYGEWGPDDLQSAVGYIPSGFGSLAGWWHAPLDGYDLPGEHDNILTQAPGYYISAIIGILAAGGAIYIIGKAVITNKE
jgi:hypothetical protein